jgi:hypothetical protein
MFPTTFAALFTHYIWLPLFAVGLIWFIGEWRRHRRGRHERRFDVLCRLCGNLFRDESGEPLVTCPSCQALNERRRPREI